MIPRLRARRSGRPQAGARHAGHLDAEFGENIVGVVPFSGAVRASCPHRQTEAERVTRCQNGGCSYHSSAPAGGGAVDDVHVVGGAGEGNERSPAPSLSLRGLATRMTESNSRPLGFNGRQEADALGESRLAVRVGSPRAQRARCRQWGRCGHTGGSPASRSRRSSASRWAWATALGAVVLRRGRGRPRVRHVGDAVAIVDVAPAVIG